MNELKTLVINGVAYAITDETKLPQPETAKVGDTLRVAQVDDQGRPIRLEAVTTPSVDVASFENIDDTDEIFICQSHTAQLVKERLRHGIPVIGILRSPGTQFIRCLFCFAEGDSRVVVGDGLIDGGWQHCMGDPDYYSDNGKELWIAY